MEETPLVEIIPLADVAAERVEALLDAAFGPDRFSRTAYACRAGTAAIPALSFAAVDGDELVGSIQCWPVGLFDDDGQCFQRLTMVGPVAVSPARQREGIGRMLMAHCLKSAENQADSPLMMIGDPEYYGRFFGFSTAVTGGWMLPGPFEKRRLLARDAGENVASATEGMIGPHPR